MWEEVREDPQKGIETFLRWDILGEASANYLFRCEVGKKVAPGDAHFLGNSFPQQRCDGRFRSAAANYFALARIYQILKSIMGHPGR